MSYGFPPASTGFRPASSLAGSTPNPFAQSAFPAPATSPFTSYQRPPEPSAFPSYGSSSFAPSSYSAQRPSTGFPSYSSAFPAPSTTSPFQSSGFPPTTSSFPSSFPSSSSYSTNYGTTGVRYAPGEERDTTGVMAMAHITSMNAYSTKSTEELRAEDYQHNHARNKSTPAPAFSASNPFASTQYPSYSSYRQPASQPTTSVFSPTPTTSSFFANPAPATSSYSAFPSAPPTQNPFAAAAPSSSVFNQNALTPPRNSFFPSYTTTQFPSATPNPAPMQSAFPAFVPPAPSASNPFASAASAFTPQPSAPVPPATASSFFVQPQQAFTSLSSYSAQRPTTPQQTYSFTPQAVPSAPVVDSHTMVQAYRDPVGLSWLFPNGVPDELLQNRQSRSALVKPTSAVEQILRTKSPVTGSLSALNMTERWRRNKDRHAFSPVRSRTESRLSPLRNDASVFAKRQTGLKLSPKAEEPEMLQLSPQKNSVQVAVRAYAPDLVQRTVTVDKRGKVSDILDQVLQFVRPRGDERLELIYRSRKLREDELVASIGLTPTEEVTVLVEQQRQPEQVSHLLPRLTKAGYSTTPSLAVLGRMSLAELQRVRDFTVRNQHGEIVFEGETDVTEVDLDAVVEIEPKAVVLYPDSKGLVKPLVGRGLNKPALVRLFDCTPKKDTGDFEKKIRKVCERNGSQFVSYDSSTGEWVFRVPHF